MEKDPKRNNWQIINQTMETLKNVFNYFCSNHVLKMFPKRYLSDTARCNKSVVCDYVFTELRYYKFVWNSALNNQLEEDKKVIQVNKVR